jgi:hypothetical protein
VHEQRPGPAEVAGAGGADLLHFIVRINMIST